MLFNRQNPGHHSPVYSFYVSGQRFLVERRTPKRWALYTRAAANGLVVQLGGSFPSRVSAATYARELVRLGENP